MTDSEPETTIKREPEEAHYQSFFTDPIQLLEKLYLHGIFLVSTREGYRGATPLLQLQLAAVAAQQATLHAEVQRLATLERVMTPVGPLQQYEAPNPQTFMPEQTTGYMYDGKTRLYYDPTTQYFYSPASEKWMYYDVHFKTYLPVEDREKVQQALYEQHVAPAEDPAVEKPGVNT
ncbi:hypothetical protein PMAYCL1PPCAC_14476, partial [Pristionchus mayeri]